MVPPSDVSGFINPMKTMVISAINHRFNGTYLHQLSVHELGHHLVRWSRMEICDGCTRRRTVNAKSAPDAVSWLTFCSDGCNML